MTQQQQRQLAVFLPNYNHGQYIKNALEAILSQSFRAAEIIVLDDGSTDNSFSIIEKFADEHKEIRALKNSQNRGIVDCANRALAECSADYIYFASADDQVLPGFFMKAMTLLNQHPQAGICSALALGCDLHQKKFWPVRTPIISLKPCYIPPKSVLKNECKYGLWFSDPTTIMRRLAVEELGGFPEKLHSHVIKFTSRLIALKYGACFTPDYGAISRYNETGIALSTQADTDRHLSAVEHTVNLMRKDYSDLFPFPFVDRWQRQQLFSVGLNIIRTSHREQTNRFRKVLPSQSPWSRLFFIGLKIKTLLETLFVRIVLTIGFKKPIFGDGIRRLRCLLMNWKLRGRYVSTVNERGSHYLSNENCPLCSCDQLQLLFKGTEKGHASYHVICKKCTLVFQDPRPDEEFLDSFYHKTYSKTLNRMGSFRGGPDDGALIRADVKAKRLWSFLSPHLPSISHPTVLDIGASAGVLLNYFKRTGYATYGVEPGEGFAEYSKKSGHQIENSVFRPSIFPGEKFNVITMSHVLEHCASPLQILREIREKLSPDKGLLVIEVPNLMKPNGPLNGFFQFPHLYTFSPSTLMTLLEGAGYEVVDWNDDFPHLRVLATCRQDGHKDPALVSLQTTEWKKIQRRLKFYNILYRYFWLPIRALRKIGLLAPA